MSPAARAFTASFVTTVCVGSVISGAIILAQRNHGFEVKMNPAIALAITLSDGKVHHIATAPDGTELWAVWSGDEAVYFSSRGAKWTTQELIGRIARGVTHNTSNGE